ncbi:MAG: endonuclease/exonuclease/phosphatase family protein [Bacteroidales bacterium]|nr:endonuclease/exonuclease/phosphatase family protein [Bacteroidales bacterium]
MKRYISTVVMVLLCVFSLEARRPSGQYRIMTCNIRITGLQEDAPYPERVWENRRDLCVRTIKKQAPDFFCLQEVIYDSYSWFVDKFGKDYHCFGFVGPEMDPWTEGYHFIGKNVIFFKKRRFELVSSGGYWLSETPTIAGSMSWGTNRARHCNWVRIRDRKTGQEMRLVNTHLDHRSDPARREQIKMVVEECGQYSEDMPQILCGDFNAGIENAPIQYIHSCEGWKEMYEDVHDMGEAGPSYHGFIGEKREKGHRIDFIFHRGPVETLGAEMVKDHEGDMYPSDHYFLVADFRIPLKMSR